MIQDSRDEGHATGDVLGYGHSDCEGLDSKGGEPHAIALLAAKCG